MNMAGKRILSFALAICLLLGIMLVTPGPVAVAAVEIQEGTGAIAVNTTVVGFGGKEWWVIGHNNSGVQQAANTLTLLAKNDDFGQAQFDDTSNRTPTSNAYEDSLLHKKMLEIYHDSDVFSEKERERINPVTLDDVNTDPNGYNIGSLSGQYVWPLSSAKANQSARPISVSSDTWWLRSPLGNGFVLVGEPSGYSNGSTGGVASSLAVRPAFQINLSSVIFTSHASGASAKSNVAVGDGLVSASAPSATDAIKFTMPDNSIAKPILTFDGTTNNTGSLRLGYSGAETGTNQYLSCVLVGTQGADNGVVKYYGKLANCATQDSGEFTIDTGGLAPGTYNLKIFCERADSDDLYTDFVGESVDMALEVSGATGGITGFPGEIATAPEIVIPPGDAAVAEGSTATFTVAASGGGLSYQWQVRTDSGTWSDVTDGAGGNTTSYTTPATTVGMDNYQYRVVVKNMVDEATSNAAILTVEAPVGTHGITITVSPTAGGNPTATPTNAAKDATVTLDARPAGGYAFDRWESGDVAIATPTQATATFTMPDNAVGITAYYIPDSGSSGDTPAITTHSLPNGRVGEAYSQALSATGDTPITWKLDSGSLPLGFSLSSSGVISGTPTQLETADFTVKAENTSGSDTRDLRIIIAAGGNGNGGSSSGSTSSNSGGSGGGSNVTPAPKNQLPASAFSWDGGRTLTIDHDNVTALGLLNVRWDGVETEAYSKYSGSVIVRFDEDFIAAQSPGDHTVRVEFLNHTGETTVTVGGTGAAGMEVSDDLLGNDTQNPSTGGDSHNPNTGHGRGALAALLASALSGAALVIFGRKGRETR